MIVRAEEPITLIGGAKASRSAFEASMALAPRVVAADGGADAALQFGVTPEAVIGDFDSISDEARERIPSGQLHEVTEQDSTDFDKCLRNISAPFIVGIGFSGARLDHQLAACNSLVRHPDQRCILIGSDDVVFLAPPSMRLQLTKGSPVSLFPLGAVEGVSDGLKWPINGLNFVPDGQIGTSNMALGNVDLAVTAPKLLVILPLRFLDEVARSLQACNARWQD